jgi:hypothetical protein
MRLVVVRHAERAHESEEVADDLPIKARNLGQHLRHSSRNSAQDLREPSGMPRQDLLAKLPNSYIREGKAKTKTRNCWGGRDRTISIVRHCGGL